MFLVKKYYLTFVEILIVIAIVTLMTGIIGVNIRQLAREQRFNTEVSLIVDELRTAQNLMLILGSNVNVKIEQLPNGGGIKYWMEVSKLLPGNWTREVDRERAKLTTIKKIEFRPANQQATANPIDIKFYSRGSLMSEGVLVLSSTENIQDSAAMLNFICLPGFPSPIQSVAKPIESKICNSREDSFYNEKLTSAIQREIILKTAGIKK